MKSEKGNKASQAQTLSGRYATCPIERALLKKKRSETNPKWHNNFANFRHYRHGKLLERTRLKSLGRERIYVACTHTDV